MNYINIVYLHLIEDPIALLYNTVHTIRYGKPVRPVVIRNPSVVLPHGQSEPQQRVLVEPVQPKQVPEHVNSAFGFPAILQVKRVEVVVIHSHHLPRNTFFEHRLVLLLGAGVVVAQHFQRHLVFLFGFLYLVVELRVVEGQSAVDGEHLEGFLVVLAEGAEVLVDHLHHTYDGPANVDGHA